MPGARLRFPDGSLKSRDQVFVEAVRLDPANGDAYLGLHETMVRDSIGHVKLDGAWATPSDVLAKAQAAAGG